MTYEPRQTILISPVSRAPLFKDGNLLRNGNRQETFNIDDEIIQLLQNDTTDHVLRHEIEVFDNLPVQGVSYFRHSLYRQMLETLFSHNRTDNRETRSVRRFAELGGGEGHWARYLADHIDHAEVFVCDLSQNALKGAPAPLKRVCADITKPIFAPGSLDAAAFWVSLHHIPQNLQRKAIEEAYCALAEGGILIIFEPNDAFIVRQIIYRSACRHDLYFDDQECAVDFGIIARMARETGFEELETYYLNPPYNPRFVRQLKRWWLYLPVVELIHQADWLMNILPGKSYTSLYGMSFLRKT